MADLIGKAKDLVEDVADKAKDYAKDHEEQIDDAIDKAADFVDKKTGGKHTEKIAKARTKAHGAADKLGNKDGK